VRTVHFVVPDSVDDPSRPSGGNTYDRRVSSGLSALGWSVVEHGLPGAWPQPSESALAALATVIGAIPDRATVLIDGLIASAVPEVLLPHAGRLRLVALVHMPLGDQPPLSDQADDTRDRERAVLSAATVVVTTSEWTRRRLENLYGLQPEHLRVCRPGAERAAIAPGTADGGALLCVAAIIPGKGHDVLIHALATVADLAWNCVCVGTVDRDADFVAAIGRQVKRLGLDSRIALTGTRTGDELADMYAAADLAVLASRAETYGMALTEALAHGLPVIASSVGGVPEAVGLDDTGRVPGILCPPEDPLVFGQALRTWLSDPRLRSRLRQGARERRATLDGWDATVSTLADVLAEVLAEVGS
jgi:glycosyltransferase involved in cell wall biosynthesis